MLIPASILAQSQNLQDSAWIRDNYTKTETYIPMRDGIKLFTTIYAPRDKTEKHPVLMNRTPYSCAPYGSTRWRNLWDPYWRYYFREGYIIVLQDVRGRWMSEGNFEDVRPFNKNKKGKETDEASDTYDTIDWLLANVAGNNGRVGVFGISYPGFYSTMAAASGHPALKAVSPQAPVTDWFMGDDFHHNGALSLMDGFNFYAGGFGYPRPLPTTVGPRNALIIPRNDNYQTFLNIGALPNFMKLTGDSIAFWKDLYNHPNYDSFWMARDARTAMFNIKPAMLVVGGLFDAEDCFGAWNLYKAIEKQSPGTDNRLVMGPWFHGQWGGRGDGSSLGNIRFGSRTSEWYQNQVELPFFNYHLKGKGTMDSLAEATIFFTGRNEWQTFKTWPPANSRQRSLYLLPNGLLAWTKPLSAKAGTTYTSNPAKPVPYTEDVHFNRTREYMTDDQRFASRRPDVITFQTEALDRDLTLGGVLTADLHVAISSTDADFVVKLIDVFPDEFVYADDHEEDKDYPMGGYQMLVRGEIMRGKFRKSFSNPVPFKPNQPDQVTFNLPDVAHTFKKGHRLMIQIQSSWFPLMDRNPQQFMNIYQAKDSDFKPAEITILHDSMHPSAIILPVLE
ncbi:putative hydrolase [Flavihumibacter petaseus NBRC 106054]|uniref:Putative hydrolase n=1 Tax=Flavihumibacter petaseus NBRC 106054 TaxID=1220578 RepID=A0A0E9N2W7_9BACT|nr:putative hydrolase [Flavihumibacter petaseus NBRC 106054]